MIKSPPVNAGNAGIARDVGSTPGSWDPPMGRENPLEQEMVTHSSILAWKIAWTEEPGRQQAMGS